MRFIRGSDDPECAQSGIGGLGDAVGIVVGARIVGEAGFRAGLFRSGRHVDP
ncbi:hypothetical protein [Prauserella halophila]|uniref:hypothetical protein n=1 Tax=Prauserella halophila TaxID=185641 RepID=UPI0031E02C6C